MQLRPLCRITSNAGIKTATLMAIAGCATSTNTPAPTPRAVMMAPNSAHVAAASPVAAGEYLTIAGGCNDCHTVRWAESNGNVAPDDRLTGNPVGYRGPWGTSYAANLRIVAQRVSEDQWVHTLTTADDGKGAPPMPWMNFKLMHDQDLRALYQYIKSLGPKGTRMPRAVPPGQTPTGPYVDFSVRQPGSE